MSDESAPAPPVSWWAEGLLFENCTCQVVCPGHIHFSQACTYDPCVGYWAIRIDDGAFGDVPLSGVKAVFSSRAPQRMIEGDWVEALVVDADATEEQRAAIEAILFGEVGGPWAVLNRFVGRRLPTRVLPIRIEEEGAEKRVVIEGIMDAEVKPIRGLDRDRPVTFSNLFNQIHAPEQVISRGTTRYDHGEVSMTTEGTHAIQSRFEWRVDAE